MFQAILQQVRELPGLGPLLRPPAIPFSVGMYDSRLTLVEVGGLPDRRPYLKAYGDAPLQGHRAPPSPAERNLEAPAQVAAALHRMVEAAEMDLRCCNLLLPDRVARVHMIPLEDSPARGEEQEKLLRWKLRKTTPYPIEEAVLDWEAYPPAGNGGEASVLLVAVRERILRQYEEVFEALGVRLAAVTLASFAVFELCAPAAGREDWAMLHVSPEGFILLAVREHRPLLYRCKTWHRPPQDIRAVLQAELLLSMEYYRARLEGKHLARLLLWGPLACEEDIQRICRDATQAAVAGADPTPLLLLPEDLGLDEAARMRLAPCLGPAIRGKP